jgi:hypothetical protein
LYVDSEESVNSLVSNGFSLNGFFVDVRRLDVQSRKLVLSNVAPEIPDSVLLDAISPLGKVTSSFSIMGASLRNPSLQHIKSFRRNIFIQLSMNENALPSSIPISYDNRNYRVFLSFGDLICFHCKKAGHAKRACPSLVPEPSSISPLGEASSGVSPAPPQASETTPSESLDNTDPPSVPTAVGDDISSQAGLQLDNLPPDDEVIAMETVDIPPVPTSSEAHPTDAAICSHSSPSLSAEWPSLAPSASVSSRTMRKRSFSLTPVRRLNAKKVRDGSASDSNDDSLTQSQSSSFCLDTEQRKALMALDPSSSPIGIEEFLSFLEEVKYSRNPGLAAQKYSDNVTGIIAMIDALRKSSTDKKLLTRLKGLRKKLKKPVEIP